MKTKVKEATEMTREQRVEYLKIALAISEIHVPMELADLVICLVDLIELKKGGLDMDTIIRTKYKVREKYAAIETINP